jgi:hypothetical protein
MYFSFWSLLLAILTAYIIIKIAKWAIHKAFYDPMGVAQRLAEKTLEDMKKTNF